MTTCTIDAKTLTTDLQRFAPLFVAYLECSDELQKHARQLFAALADPQADEDDRQLTAMTLADLLFPNPYEGDLGSDLHECEAQGAQHFEETRETLERMDREEATFADCLRKVMEEKGVTQVRLAEQLGIGQSAVAMMLQRECRPQKRTVRRMAEALQVSPERLWPGFRS